MTMTHTAGERIELGRPPTQARQLTRVLKRHWGIFQERRRCARISAALHGMKEWLSKDIGLSRVQTAYFVSNRQDEFPESLKSLQYLP